tara:strand:+ start:283 stop:1014 length:732 start_codon:yes stop_codon:yes gene_type:complete
MVSIDTVYQRVLALANKEQRGYIPPVKFNLYANQAQMDIFEQYFHDRSQFGRVNGNQTQTADSVDIIEEKIALFNLYDRPATILNNFGDVNINNDFKDYYRLQMVRVDYTDIRGFRQAENVSLQDLSAHSLSPLLKNNKTYPIYTNYSTTAGDNRVKVYPYPDQNTERVLVSYIRKPSNVNWNGVNVNGNLVYSAGQDFELHTSEETKLVVKILQLAAIAMKDPGLLAIASREDIKNIQQEKQ